MSQTFATRLRIYSFGLTCGLYLLAASLPTANALDQNVTGYAWGENLGWVNFGLDEGAVTVTDTAVTGYIWSGTYGWINLGPFTQASGVTNTAQGVLGGYAWIDQLGWLSMSGVVVTSTGELTGIANTTGTRAGRLAFTCRHCSVRTSWRPTALLTTAVSQVAVAVPALAAVAVKAAPPAVQQPVVAAATAVAKPASTAPAAGNLFDVTVKRLADPRQFGWWWLLIIVLIIATWFGLLRRSAIKARQRREALRSLQEQL